VANHVDILFANETEITALYQRNSFQEAAEAVRGQVALAALTRSEAGSVILRGAETVTIAAAAATVVDTTGAGDAYAAGFLAGLTAGKSLDLIGRMGSIAAAEIIGHFGARPEADLRTLMPTR
jgi:sugar/nucleoside kinase (ribokinase family)